MTIEAYIKEYIGSLAIQVAAIAAERDALAAKVAELESKKDTLQQEK